MIEHIGVVQRVEGDAVYVKITSQSACGACQARQACGLAEAQDKIVTVRTPEARQYAVDEQVVVGIRQGMGGVAVALAYVGALVVLLVVLFASTEFFGLSEGLSALAALCSVAIYYGCLWLARNKIDNIIKITIIKNN